MNDERDYRDIRIPHNKTEPSKEGARFAQPAAAKKSVLIMWALDEAGERGLSHEEISNKTAIKMNTCGGIINQLWNNGHIKRKATRETRLTPVKVYIYVHPKHHKTELF